MPVKVDASETSSYGDVSYSFVKTISSLIVKMNCGSCNEIPTLFNDR